MSRFPTLSRTPSRPLWKLTGAALVLLGAILCSARGWAQEVTTQITGWALANELASASRPVGDSIILDAGTRGVIVHFAASVPGAQYRYRLDAYDADWTDTQDTVAHYRHLPAGHFLFQVESRLPNTAWTNAPASIPLIQRPFFYQTWYFYLLVVLLLILLAWQLLSQRDQLLKGQMGIVLEERNRIASDCHDTLMAGFAAVSWQLEATSRLFQEAGAAETPAASSCELARSMVAHCQSEARRIIWDLRDSEQLTDVLSQALSRAIETHRLRNEVDTTFELVGEEISIAPGAVHHLVCIGQEAVTNAIRHASATRIHVTLRYETEALILTVRDNGRGFNISGVVTKPGHFGIPVMQERARKLGGALRMNSTTQNGTEVIVSVDFQSIDRAGKQQQNVVPWIGV